MDVMVEKRVAWPHDIILRGNSRQRVTYDQLSLTQFVQGFSKSIVDESEQRALECMFDFAWANTKAAHSVILCENERGFVELDRCK